jgi:hypothetical protein
MGALSISEFHAISTQRFPVVGAFCHRLGFNKELVEVFQPRAATNLLLLQKLWQLGDVGGDA